LILFLCTSKEMNARTGMYNLKLAYNIGIGS